MEEKLKQEPSSCLKVVLMGPESTGKTYLCKQLADYFNTLWVPEYSREYALKKLKTEIPLSIDDIIPIAEGQMYLENSLSKKVRKLLICDTNLLETKVYAELYYDGYCPIVLEKYALQNNYDLCFLSYIDTPWEADEIRDKPNEREHMFLAFKQTLTKYKLPYVLLKGNKKERLEKAIYHIEKLLITQ